MYIFQFAIFCLYHCALFSNELTLTQKLNIIETEYKIPLDQTRREDVNVMCNL